MLRVNQLIAELEERDPEAIVKLDGDRDITNIEVMDDGNVSIEGDSNDTN